MPVDSRSRKIWEIVSLFTESFGVPRKLVEDNIGILLSLYDFLTAERVLDIRYNKVTGRLRIRLRTVV